MEPKPFMVRVERGEYGGKFWYEDFLYPSMDEAQDAYNKQIETALSECAKAHGRPITNIYLYDRTQAEKTFEHQVIKHDVVEKSADTGEPICHAFQKAAVTPPGWMKIEFPKPDASYANLGVVAGVNRKHWGN